MTSAHIRELSDDGSDDLHDEIRPVDDEVSIDGDIPGLHDDNEFSDAIELLAQSLATVEGLGIADIMVGVAESLAKIAEGTERNNKVLFKMAKALDKIDGTVAKALEKMDDTAE